MNVMFCVMYGLITYLLACLLNEIVWHLIEILNLQELICCSAEYKVR